MKKMKFIKPGDIVTADLLCLDELQPDIAGRFRQQFPGGVQWNEDGFWSMLRVGVAFGHVWRRFVPQRKMDKCRWVFDHAINVNTQAVTIRIREVDDKLAAEIRHSMDQIASLWLDGSTGLTDRHLETKRISRMHLGHVKVAEEAKRDVAKKCGEDLRHSISLIYFYIFFPS